MTTEQAIKILKKHNKWRRLGGVEQLSPVDIGIAIDTAIRIMQQNLKKDVANGG